MKCRKCNSTNVGFTKHKHYGNTHGVSYHYRLYCMGCGADYYTKKNSEIYKEVEDKEWVKSKSYMRKYGDNKQMSF